MTVIHTVIGPEGRMVCYGTDAPGMSEFARELGGTVEPVSDHRWYSQAAIVVGEPHPADRDAARELAAHQLEVQRAEAEGLPAPPLYMTGPPILEGQLLGE